MQTLENKEVQAYLECKRYQRFSEALKTDVSLCFRCRAPWQVVHLLNIREGKAYAFDGYLLLCHRCHAMYH